MQPTMAYEGESDDNDTRGHSEHTRRYKGRAVKCQVAGCKNELNSKAYYKRYRICMVHCNLPSLTLSGQEKRWCQQCGRFQDLADFDEDRKTCRAKLNRHNTRRKTARSRSRVSAPSPGPSPSAKTHSRGSNTPDSPDPSPPAAGPIGGQQQQQCQQQPVGRSRCNSPVQPLRQGDQSLLQAQRSVGFPAAMEEDGGHPPSPKHLPQQQPHALPLAQWQHATPQPSPQRPAQAVSDGSTMALQHSHNFDEFSGSSAALPEVEACRRGQLAGWPVHELAGEPGAQALNCIDLRHFHASLRPTQAVHPCPNHAMASPPLPSAPAPTPVSHSLLTAGGAGIAHPPVGLSGTAMDPLLSSDLNELLRGLSGEPEAGAAAPALRPFWLETWSSGLDWTADLHDAAAAAVAAAAVYGVHAESQPALPTAGPSPRASLAPAELAYARMPPSPSPTFAPPLPPLDPEPESWLRMSSGTVELIPSVPSSPLHTSRLMPLPAAAHAQHPVLPPLAGFRPAGSGH